MERRHPGRISECASWTRARPVRAGTCFGLRWQAWSAVASAARHRFGLFATKAEVWSSAFRRLLLLKTSPPKSVTSKPKRRRRCALRARSKLRARRRQEEARECDPKRRRRCALRAHSRYCSHRRADQNHPGVPILLRQNVLARGEQSTYQTSFVGQTRQSEHGIIVALQLLALSDP
jgi:hypothetical protein